MRVLRTAAVGLVCALMASPAFAQRDHYMCYAVKQTKGPAAYGKTEATKKLYAGIDDILSGGNPQGLDPSAVPGVSTTVQMKKVKELCIPTEKNLEGVTDGDTNYVMYQISPQKGQCSLDSAVPCKGDDDCDAAGAGVCNALSKFDKKDPQNTGVRVVDQFSDLRLDFGKEVMALVPASADAAAFQGAPSGEEQYKCYSVKPAKSSCVGGTNDGETCKDSSTCGGGTCTANPKFPKDTHPNGISASIENGITGLFDGGDPEKAMNLAKLKMFCQAADKKLASSPNAARSEEQAGLLCYAAKAAKAACHLGANDNEPCKSDDDCVGGTCVAEPKFDKKNSNLLGNYVEDDIFQHRLDVAKEDMFCVPACRGYEGFTFTDQLLHVSNAALGNGPGPLAGLPNGVDLNGDSNIDNMIGNILGGILGSVLQDEIDGGGINILFQASALANGPITVTGFLGDLDSDSGCTTGAGTPGNPVDPGNPSDPCNYILDSDGLNDGLKDSCVAEGLITLNVDVAGAESAPTASAEGGGPGSNFTLSLSLGGIDLTLTAQNVVVDADLTHDGTDISQILGVLGGGVRKTDLVEAIATLPSECFGGANDGAACTTDGDCTGGDCAIFEGLVGGPITDNTGPQLAVFIEDQVPADLDLDPNSAWPGDAKLCADCESVSLGLQFRGTRAVRTGVTSIDN